MWAAWVVAAIALAASAFMLRFLIALLSEGAPSICYWVVPVHRELQKEGHLEALSGIYLDGSCRAPEGKRRECYVDLLENEGYAKECDSGLIALDVRPVSARRVWRSSQPRRGYVFREHRL
jgi:hypothetical protein